MIVLESYGNVYVFPATRGDFEAEMYTWVRKEQLDLADELFAVARECGEDE